MYKTDIDNLYKDLKYLVTNHSEKYFGFTSTVLSLEDQTYEVFDYGLVGYQTFQLKNAENCRGTTFNITDPNNPILVSLPPPKFFNYEEGNVKHSKEKNQIRTVMEKLDGSLISTYLHKDKVLLKSKGHLFSTQAVAVNKLLFGSVDYEPLAKDVVNLAKNGFTINFEYTSPSNLIVVIYPADKLSVLSIRDNSTGELFFGESIKEKFKDYKEILNNLVSYRVLNAQGNEIEKFIDSSREEKIGEGYVIEVINHELNKVYLVKAKNSAYIAKHHVKDGVSKSKSNLMQVILEGVSDDIKQIFADSPQMIKEIEDFENIIFDKFNYLNSEINDFYNLNKDLDRKSYALKVNEACKKQSYLKMPLFNKYQNREFNLKEIIFDNRKEIFPDIDFTNQTNEKDIQTTHSVNKSKLSS